MNKKIYTFLLVFLFCTTNVYAAPNVETKETIDSNTDSNKCPVEINVKDGIDFSMFDSIYKYEEITDNLYYDFTELEKYFTDIDKKDMDKFVEDLVNSVGQAENTTNKYCPVYCAEEDTFVFPGYAPVINSGGHFTWTIGKDNDANILNGLTTRLQGIKHCVTNVDIEKWIADYKKALKDIADYITAKPPEVKAGYSGGSGSGRCGNYKGGYRKPENGVLSPNPLCKYISTEDLGIIQESGISIDNGIGYSGGASGVINSIGGAHADGRYTYYFSHNVNITDMGIIQREQALHSINNYAGDENSYSLETALQYAGDTIASGTIRPNWNLSGMQKRTCIYEFEKACCDWKKLDTYTDPGTYIDHNPGLTQFAGSVDNVVNKYEYEGCSVDTRYNCQKYQSCIGGGIDPKTGKYVELKCTTKEYCHTKYTNCKTSYYEAYCTFSSGLPPEQGEAARKTITSSNWSSSAGTPTCPSGYRLGSNNTCYWANTKDIENKIRKLRNLIEQLKSCSTLLESFDYYLETDMKLEYNQNQSDLGLTYGFTQDLEKVDVNNDNQRDMIGQYAVIGESKQIPTKSNASATISLYSYNNTQRKTFDINSSSIPFYFCDLGHAIELRNYWNDYYSKTFVATYEYKMDGDTYRWVKMPSGESISTMPTGDYLKYNRFIDIGYANYPVHFATPANKYDGLNIKITNIGYKNYLNKTYQTQINNYNNSLTDNQLVSELGQNQLLHDCYYEVTEGEPYCPTTGCGNDEYDLGSVRIIYRPISLENPFPDIDASGRETGSNWCVLNDETSDCSNTNKNVEKYISNNRNTEGSSIYFEFV